MRIFSLVILGYILISTIGVSYAAPSTPPPNGYTGGIFSVYFKNMVEGNSTSLNSTTNGLCPIGQGIIGYRTTLGVTYGTPICGQVSSPQYWTSNNGGGTIYFTGAGNVGIGTSTPSYKLHVNGVGYFGDPSASYNPTTYSQTYNNTIQLGSFPISYTLYNSYDGGYWGNLFIGGAGMWSGRRNTLNGSFNQSVGGTALGNMGTGTSNNVFGWGSLWNMTTGGSNTAMGRDTGYNLTTGNSNSFFGAFAGRDLITGSNNIAIGAGAQLPSSTASNQLNIGNWIYGNNGRIGIGVQNPSYNFEVNGTSYFWQSVNFRSDVVLRWHNPNGSQVTNILSKKNGTATSIGNETELWTAGGGLEIKNPWGLVNTYFQMGTASDPGNVGIGTTTPSAKLEVAGQVKITGGAPGAGKVLTSDTTGLASWQIPSPQSINNFAGSCWSTRSIINGTNSSNRTGALMGFTIDNCLDPIFELNIGGTPNTVFANSTAKDPVQEITFYTSPTSSINTGYSRLRITGDGNIGIGTENPSAKLDVSGTNAANFGTTTQCCSVLGYTIGISEATSSNSRLATMQFHNAGFSEGFIRLASSDRTFEFGDNQGVGADIAIRNTANTARNVVISGKSTSYFNGGNVGIGTTAPSNAQGWNRVLDVRGPDHAKLLVGTVNGNVQGGLFAHNPPWIFGGPGFYIGSESSHPIALMAGYGNPVLTGLTNGNIGIGTTAPLAKLEVNGNIHAAGSPVPANWYNLQAGSVGVSTLYGYTAVCTGNASGNCQAGGGTVLGINNTSASNNIPNSGTVFFNAGSVGIGTTTPSRRLSVEGSMTLRSGDPTVYLRDTDHNAGMIHMNSNLMYFLRGCGNDTESWCTNRNGWWPLYLDMTNSNAYFGADVYAFNYYYNSDKNLKKDIVKIDSALDKINRLNGYYFTWKKDNTASIGVIAQEIEKEFPQIVSKNTDASGETYKTVQYGNLVAPLIEATKELSAQNQSQQKEIEELRKEIEELKSIISHR